jgi:hypothetical protein
MTLHKEAITVPKSLWYVTYRMVIRFFSSPKPHNGCGVTEMSTGNLPGGKGRPARKADNLTAICEPII